MSNRSIIVAAALAFGTVSAPLATAQDAELEAKISTFKNNLVNPAVPPDWFKQAAEENSYVRSAAENRYGYNWFYASDVKACRSQMTGVTGSFNANSIVKCIRTRDNRRFSLSLVGVMLGGPALFAVASAKLSGPGGECG